MVSDGGFHSPERDSNNRNTCRNRVEYIEILQVYYNDHVDT